jgi:hypothetical protein
MMLRHYTVVEKGDMMERKEKKPNAFKPSEKCNVHDGEN